MPTLLMVSSSPYGSEGPYNALRLAEALQVKGESVDLVLMGDAVLAGKAGQDPRTAHASLEGMLDGVVERGVAVSLCGTCCRTRGLAAAELVPGTRMVTIHDIADLTVKSDRVVSF